MKNNIIILVSILAILAMPVQVLCQSQKVMPVTSLNDIDELNQKRAKALVGQTYDYSESLAQITGIPLDSLKDKIIFLHTWFASCAPCMAEFEELSKIYKTSAPNKKFLFLSLTFEDEKTINETKLKYPLPYLVYRTDRQSCNRLNLTAGYPANVLFRKGLIIDKLYTAPPGDVSQYVKNIIARDIEAALTRVN